MPDTLRTYLSQNWLLAKDDVIRFLSIVVCYITMLFRDSEHEIHSSESPGTVTLVLRPML